MRIGEITTNMEFFVMNIHSPYNAILRRNWLGEIKAVAFPFHQKLKFTSPKGIIVVRDKQEDARYFFNLVIRRSLFRRKTPSNSDKIVTVVQ